MPFESELQRITTMKYLRLIFLASLFSGFNVIKAQNVASNAQLPVSEINIPFQISLKPIFQMAEKQVDTVFTSPQYPTGWVQSDCSTRYKYYFRRSPLKMSASGTTFNLAFTGNYRITGSTRACVSGTAISPWTPECRCGFDEGDRKVNIGFSSTFTLHPNYILRTKIIRTEPQALNKCTVCFWGQDITATVMDGLKKELDLSRKMMEDSFGTVNLRPYLQQVWNKLNDVYPIPEAGYFTLNPKQLRMEKLNAVNDLLNIQIGISATPQITLIKPQPIGTVIPNLAPASNREGFNIHLEAALQYDSLSKVINGYLQHKRFDLSEGILKRHIIVEECKVYSGLNDNMVVEMAFRGSHSGTVYFTGKPVYNHEKKQIEMQSFDYDLQTRDFLLKTAKWLFNNKIVSEIRKHTSIDMSSYYDTAKVTLNEWLNKEWTTGIKGSGNITDLRLTDVKALESHLLIRTNCSGKLNIAITALSF